MAPLPEVEGSLCRIVWPCIDTVEIRIVLYSFPHPSARSTLPPIGRPQLCPSAILHGEDQATAIRQAFQRTAEVAARCGAIEIIVDARGHERDSKWSAGVYALLGHPLHAAPLSRESFIRTYVDADDQTSVRSVSLDLLSNGGCGELAYRVLPTHGRSLLVLERFTEVVIDAHERLIFCSLSSAPAEADSAVRGSFEVLAAFDAMKDAERQRLRRDMHDDFGQLLAAMKMDLALLDQQLGGTSPGSRTQTLKNLVDTMIGSVRRIVAEQPPQVIEEIGLVCAIERLVDDFRRRYGLHFELAFPPRAVVLPLRLQESVYRIVQEALQNIARHAGAASVQLSLRCNARRLVLQINDDGRGASADDLAKVDSFGLRCMRERVASLGGSMALHALSQRGTALCIDLPLPG